VWGDQAYRGLRAVIANAHRERGTSSTAAIVIAASWSVRVSAMVCNGLGAGGKWIRTFGSARDW
jgi:hypothetical protein